MLEIILLLFAVTLDLLAGEPPKRWHPVVWAGHLIQVIEKRVIGDSRAYGIVLLSIMVGIASGIGLLIEYVRPMSPILYVLIGGYFLKSTFSIKELLFTGIKIRDSLLREDLGGARAGLNALVGRDPMGLDETHVSSAVIESLAENFVDGFLSPLFYYVLLGLPGAMAFKAVSTLDSMVGYQNEKYLDLGWASARADDFLNYVPARIGGILLAHTGRGSFSALRDRKKPSSPNSGWPMAAMAGALGVWLEKPGYYRIEGERGPTAGDISGALWRIAAADAIVLVLIILFI